MAKNGVDGVYDSDPRKNKNAVKYDEITYQEVIEKDLQVMDQTATSLCKDNTMPLVVFNMNEKGNIYILDEPTTGLHFDDIKVLLGVLQQLVEQGNTVIIIEHNLDVLKSVDYIFDMGPEGGKAGGMIVAEGTPEELAENQVVKDKYLTNSFKLRKKDFQLLGQQVR